MYVRFADTAVVSSLDYTITPVTLVREYHRYLTAVINFVDSTLLLLDHCTYGQSTLVPFATDDSTEVMSVSERVAAETVCHTSLNLVKSC